MKGKSKTMSSNPKTEVLIMNTFNQIIAALGGGNGPWDIGDDPPLHVTLNPGSRSLIFALNAGVHITVYEDSWNGTVQIRDLGGELVNVGPYCLHVTAGGERWFRQYAANNWSWVTDYGTPTERYLKAFNALMNTVAPYLG